MGRPTGLGSEARRHGPETQPIPEVAGRLRRFITSLNASASVWAEAFDEAGYRIAHIHWGVKTQTVQRSGP